MLGGGFDLFNIYWHSVGDGAAIVGFVHGYDGVVIYFVMVRDGNLDALYNASLFGGWNLAVVNGYAFGVEIIDQEGRVSVTFDLVSKCSAGIVIVPGSGPFQCCFQRMIDIIFQFQIGDSRWRKMIGFGSIPGFFVGKRLAGKNPLEGRGGNIVIVR